jgi:hypothetical protein
MADDECQLMAATLIDDKLSRARDEDLDVKQWRAKK